MKLKRKQKFYVPERDGITQGLLAKFMFCREACYNFCRGWSTGGITPGMTFGTISHGCLEYVYQDLLKGRITKPPSRKRTKRYLRKVEKVWLNDHTPVNKKGLDVLESSLLFAEAVLPEYFKFWHKDFTDVHWHSLEGEFYIPYTIQRGRYAGVIIPIRGKKDGQFNYHSQKDLWLFETKNKSRINEGTLLRTLPFELQVQLYLWALKQDTGKTPAGALYNVIRRPGLHQRQKETLCQLAIRCADDVKKRPDWYFMRYEIAIARGDIKIWVQELDGLISDFYGWYKKEIPHYRNTGSCEHKYGVCEYLSVCSEGDYSNLEKRNVVFRELEDL